MRKVCVKAQIDRKTLFLSSWTFTQTLRNAMGIAPSIIKTFDDIVAEKKKIKMDTMSLIVQELLPSVVCFLSFYCWCQFWCQSECFELIPKEKKRKARIARFLECFSPFHTNFNPILARITNENYKIDRFDFVVRCRTLSTFFIRTVSSTSRTSLHRVRNLCTDLNYFKILLSSWQTLTALTQHYSNGSKRRQAFPFGSIIYNNFVWN